MQLYGYGGMELIECKHHALRVLVDANVVLDANTTRMASSIMDIEVLGIGLIVFVTQYGADYPGLFVIATITSQPVVIVFLVFQRALVGGLSVGAVK